MIDLTFSQIENAKVKLYDGNPTVKRFGLSPILADPSVLTPDISHDKKWHLFCHTIFGIYHFESADGIAFKKIGKVLNRAMRADINFVDGEYYLYYERVQPLLKKARAMLPGGKWMSEIYLTKSADLKKFSKPIPIVTANKDYQSDRLGTSISNPFLLAKSDLNTSAAHSENDNGSTAVNFNTIAAISDTSQKARGESKNRLYFSAGLTFIDDCGFSEPTHISYAESDSLDSGFASLDRPILSPDKNDKYLNLCCGCLKVYKIKDGFMGLQNGIYLDNDGNSHSAIMLLKSSDGKSFQFIRPLIEPSPDHGGWMAQYVYASCLTYFDGKLRLYFNARNVANITKGREHIGFAELEI